MVFIASLAPALVMADPVSTLATTLDAEPVVACVIARDVKLTPMMRTQLSHCLAWVNDESVPTCRGQYTPISAPALADPTAVQIKADEVSLYSEGRSRLSGHVQVRQDKRIVSAQTAYIYRDANKNEVTKIELLNEVRFVEPDKLMIARKVVLNPRDKTGKIEDVLYRFNLNRANYNATSWGRASFVERFANKDYLLGKATYSTCPPHNESWHIEADEIKLDSTKSVGTAKNATLRVGDLPVLYAPYLTFPTSNERKSGFLMPFFGYSNVSGFNVATPYYWNIAPNYDATITPQAYTLRGLMLGGDFRYLTENSIGVLGGQFLPQDQAFRHFIATNREEFPSLNGTSTDRWSFLMRDSTQLAPDLSLHIDFQKISDDYYLQDFSNNLAVMTENQLLQQGDVTYTTEHWLLRGLLQSYQTPHPVNQAPIFDAYQRLPQLLAEGAYSELPMGAEVKLVGQFDEFKWPSDQINVPHGPRYHFNPIVSLPEIKPWGYITPSVELVENFYDVQYNQQMNKESFNRTIPRYSVDSGLTFAREWGANTQTIEPRLYYLNVPYQNQTQVPVYESAYMIFSTEQLFRTNRFSGFDRIGDTNQLSYAVTSRWLSDRNGEEKASLSVGQISYFSNRHVGLCYAQDGTCIEDPLYLGYLSPIAKSSPIASHGMYRINSLISTTADYVFDPHTSATNNGNVNFHYQPADNQLINIGYNYLIDGNLLPTANGGVLNTALHQATVAFAQPLSDRWSTLGAYSYNISKGYSMLGLLGMQYDNCCWAMRFMGGRTFMSLSTNSLQPQYNNNVYFQVLLKGLGTVAYSNPSSVVRSYLPTYKDLF